MFYIATRLKSLRREALFTRLLPTLVVFISLTVVTILSWKNAHQALDGRLNDASPFQETSLISPGMILWGGFLFNLTLSGFVYLLITNHMRSIAEKESRSIEAAKDELLALASHQLRTPATGVKQYIGMLIDGFAGDLTPLQMSLLHKAYQSNERQLGTINEMLFVARIDAGHLKMEREVFDVSMMVRSIIEEFKPLLRQKEQKLTFSIRSRSLKMRGDEQYIRMAYENLVSNATKYTAKKGKIKIELKSDGKNICFLVSDTGVGVAKHDLNLLFKKFSRVPNDLTNQVSGSGMGLYLVRKVADGHHGSVTFYSQPGEGSTVTMLVPRRYPLKD